MTVRLNVRGALVGYFDIPPFDVPPDVLVWGVRTFMLDQTANAADEPHVYEECFTFAIVTEARENP